MHHKTVQVVQVKKAKRTAGKGTILPEPMDKPENEIWFNKM